MSALLLYGRMDKGNNTDVLEPDEFSPARMRQVLGYFASGVVVVTAKGPDGPAGFTCQSFASLSLEPPLIMLCPSRTSTTWPKIREAGRFCVNVLAEHHRDVSDQFARSGTDKFAGVAWWENASRVPVLAGVCAWIECNLDAEYSGGDHTVVVGRVRALHADPTSLPLLFHRGGYGIARSGEPS